MIAGDVTDWSIGVDIGGTTTRASALGPGLEAAHTVRSPTGHGARPLILGTIEAIGEVISECAEPPARIGIGLPGRVDHLHGTVSDGVNLGLDGRPVPLAELVADEFGVPVHLENDVNAATLGAAHLSFDDPSSIDVAYLSVGTGIAAGFLLHGKLRRGWSGAAGELGHLSVDPGGPLCACGQRGCIEALSSGASIAERWPAAAQGGVLNLLRSHMAGNPRATDVWEKMSYGLAAAVDAIVLSVDPEVIMVGGGVAEIGEPLLLALLHQLARRHSGSAYLRGLEIGSRVSLAPRKFEIGAIGAALSAFAFESGRIP